MPRKECFAAHAKLFIFLLSFSKPSTFNGWCWQATMGTNVIHSICSNAFVPLIHGDMMATQSWSSFSDSCYRALCIGDLFFSLLCMQLAALL